jgi:site-specific DNA-methyltransferase (adenine-specific)
MSFDKVTIGNATLFCGDAFEILPTLEDEKIDFLASDPPYATESFGGKCTACEWDKPIPLPEFWQLVERKAKPAANIILFCNMKFAFDLIGTNTKGFRNDMVWAKSNRVGHLNSNNQVMRSHENILLFRRPKYSGTPTYNPVKTAGGRPRVSRGKARKNGGVYPPGRDYTTVSNGDTHPISVLAFDRDRNLPDWCAHPTMKPETLFGYFTLLFSDIDNMILDPFMGAGTCGSAAIRLNRKFIGIERERKFFDIACRRLEEVQRRKERYKPRITDPDDPNELEAAAEQLVCS